jgi:hypothetical protein
VLLFGQAVEPGRRDDVVVFWTDGEERRAILGCGYAEAHVTLPRLLRRFRGARSYYDSLRTKVGELAEPGAVIAARAEGHSIGLMMPFLACETGPESHVLCRSQRGQPASPVICASKDDARAFARRASVHAGLCLSGWQVFQGECLRSPVEQLFVRNRDGTVILRSELEEALTASRARSRGAGSRPKTSQREAA